MIRNEAGAAMTLEHNCFVGNQVVGPGLVHQVWNSDVSSMNNYVSGSSGGGTDCGYLALMPNASFFEPIGCIAPEAETCALIPTRPSAVPTSFPSSQVPSSLPSLSLAPSLAPSLTFAPSRGVGVPPSSPVAPPLAQPIITPSPTAIPSTLPTMAPQTAAPVTVSPSTSREGEYVALLSSIGVSGISQDGTPQNDALLWLINDDPAALSPSSPRLVQRYLLAAFYFASTTGGRSWGFCGRAQPGQSNVCSLPTNWVSGSAARWLSSDHECLWFGVRCGTLSTEVDERDDYSLDILPRSSFPTQGEVSVLYIGEYYYNREHCLFCLFA